MRKAGSASLSRACADGKPRQRLRSPPRRFTLPVAATSMPPPKPKKRPSPGRDRFYRPPRPCDVGFWRIATAPLRRWPDFLVIGAQRGGTTSLYEYLCRHPEIAAASEKEVHYFDFQLRRGSAWYRAHFPLRLPFARRRLTGEATPFYLVHPQAPRAVRALLPSVRLIVLLRDPVERAHSHYRLQKRMKIERLPTFEAALEAEPARLAGQHEKILRGNDYYSYEFNHYGYVARGIYQPQIAAWLEHFPREQILILPSETFYARPAEVFARVCDFLGLGCPAFLRDDPPNLNHEPGEPMADATRCRLREYFAPHNASLARFLGQDFPWA